MNRRKTPRGKKSKLARGRGRQWALTIDSTEAAVNLFSILLAFQQSEGGGLIEKGDIKHIGKWLEIISKQVPDVERLASDARGPFRERDTLPTSASLKLNAQERVLMLFICKTIYNQLITPKGRRNWIENHGRADYELAVKNYQDWITSLEKVPQNH